MSKVAVISEVDKLNKRFDKLNSKIRQNQKAIKDVMANKDNLFVETIECTINKCDNGRWVARVNGMLLEKSYKTRYGCRKAIKKYVKAMRSNKSFEFDSVSNIVKETFYL